MKRIIYILITIVLVAGNLAAQQLDSSGRVQLKENIEIFFTKLALDGVSLEKQAEEADKMIDILSGDSLLMSFTAETIYKYYSESPLMGAENVAVHVFDRWFADGPLKMEDDMDFLNARIYADFNRQSLIGKKAPELVMMAIDGLTDTLRMEGMYTVLFFYDTDCAKCQVETILLDKLFATEKYPVRFISVYVGDDFKKWDEYEDKHFCYDNDVIDSYSYIDPEIDSDYQRKYGVLQTPRMFLINPEGIIIGRGLDTQALSEMLSMIFEVPELEYGSDESAKLFDGIFEGRPTVEDVRRIADYIEESTKGNDVMFRQLTGDMLYWISNKTGEDFKEGMDYLVDDKILSRPEIWKTADDSLKVVGLAQFMDSLLEKARPGMKIAPLKVPAEHIRSVGSKSGEFRLDKLRGQRNIIIFHTEGCGICEAENAAARGLAKDEGKTRVLLVNVDEIISSYSDLGSELFEAFDLSSLPFIIETDRKGIIQRRYLTLIP